MKSRKEFAVKILNAKQSTTFEVEALRAGLNHPNIVQFHEAIHDNAYTYIVTELLDGQELFHRVQAEICSETDAKHIFAQLVRAVQHLHHNGIIHRDMKLENVMVLNDAEMTVKIIDFGFACTKESPEASTLCYTLEYVAPEVLNNQVATEACDVWSLGVILYTMLCRRKPFRGEPRPRKDVTTQIKHRIRAGAYDQSSDEWRALSDSVRDLISALLTVDVKERITIDEVAQHRWLNESETDVQLEAEPEHEPEPVPEPVVEEIQHVETVGEEATVEEVVMTAANEDMELETHPVNEIYTNNDSNAPDANVEQFEEPEVESSVPQGDTVDEEDDIETTATIHTDSQSTELDHFVTESYSNDGNIIDSDQIIVYDVQDQPSEYEHMPEPVLDDGEYIVTETVVEADEPHANGGISSTAEQVEHRTMSVDMVIQEHNTDDIIIDESETMLPIAESPLYNNNSKFVEETVEEVREDEDEQTTSVPSDDGIETSSVISDDATEIELGFGKQNFFRSMCRLIDLGQWFKKQQREQSGTQLTIGMCQSIIRRRSASSDDSIHEDNSIYKHQIVVFQRPSDEERQRASENDDCSRKRKLESMEDSSSSPQDTDNSEPTQAAIDGYSSTLPASPSAQPPKKRGRKARTPKNVAPKPNRITRGARRNEVSC